MYLDNIKFSALTKINFIQRKWYGRYIFKAVVEVDKTKLKINDRSSNSNLYWNWNKNHYSNGASLLAITCNEIDDLLGKGNHRLRSEGLTVSVFTNDENNIRLLSEHYGARLKSIDKPVSDEHVAVIEKHKKVVVRKTLFENQYRFKVYLKYNWDQRIGRYHEVQEFLKNYENYSVNSALKQFFYTEKNARNLGQTVAVYFSNPEDLMMFQLKFNNDILKIEESVLLSDL